VKVGIIGASGYSGAELVRLLSRHPNVSLDVLTSRQLAGKPASAVFPSLRGRMEDLVLSDSDAQALARHPEVELFFLALPHGVAVDYAKALLDGGKSVIDLSADFRLSSVELYREFYGEHPAPELLEKSVYFLPEYSPREYLKRSLIASPGCYPTSILLPLLPLARAGLLAQDSIIVNSVSGVSGAGKKLAETYLYCERNESVKAYGIPKHRHLSEIEEQLSLAFGSPTVIQFTPHLVPMNRGIASTIVVEPVASASLESAYQVWEKEYAGRPFISILPTGQTPDTAEVVGTNRIDMSIAEDPRTNRWIITSCIDNLLKGASGQAVQIMNLKYGFSEAAGLQP
jgi:N-acetyl-gamma-glutamyl-phosphate reductase